MDANIYTEYKEICKFITDNKLSNAFLSLSEIIKKLNSQKLKISFENVKETYSYFLEYNLKGVEDPEREKIYKSVQKKLYEIADTVKSEYLLKLARRNKLSAQKQLLNEQIKDNKITPATELIDLVNCNLSPENEERKLKLHKLFFILWLSDYLGEEDYSVIKKYSASGKLYYHESSVIVSALTISLLRHFDEMKFYALFDFYDADKPGVWNRALVGILLVSYIYDKRLYLYPNLIAKLHSVSKDEGISKHTEEIIYQIIRSRETEKLSKKLQDEIIPEMQKFRPKIQDKLNLDDIISEGLTEDLNPDWEEIFDDAPELLDKMADFSKMQMEGSDVFMSAFAQFKNFPFFRQTANWFMPFYPENSDIKNIFSDTEDDFDFKTFVEGLERSAFICNSDKYSFCFNIGMMPAAQKKMITELFKQESKQMQEITDEDKLLNKETEDKHIFIQYIQDLYRFFKLHPLKNDIEDIFETDLDIHNTELYSILVKDEKVAEKIAELNFKKGFYADAAEILEKLKFDDLKKEAKRFEKTGFCYQKIKNYKKALDFYKKAEIIRDSSIWLIKKIAFCNRKLQNFEEALKYYLQAEKEDEENLQIQANIGHCYLASGDYENALKKYFKVEYYEPDNKTVMRPLAWCSFVVGKFDTAESYYKKLLKENPTAYDFINYGHLLISQKKNAEAAEMYVKAAEKGNIKTVEDSIEEDKDILKKYGLTDDKINLLIDYIKIKTL